jgi:hypothetical protein
MHSMYALVQRRCALGSFADSCTVAARLAYALLWGSSPHLQRLLLHSTCQLLLPTCYFRMV